MTITLSSYTRTEQKAPLPASKGQNAGGDATGLTLRQVPALPAQPQKNHPSPSQDDRREAEVNQRGGETNGTDGVGRRSYAGEEDRPWEPAAWWYSTDALLLERRSTSRENPLRNSNLLSDVLLFNSLPTICIQILYYMTYPPVALAVRLAIRIRVLNSHRKLETFPPVRIHCMIPLRH